MTRKTCSVKGCDREEQSLGWCGAHVARFRRTGDVQADKPIGKPRGIPQSTPRSINLAYQLARVRARNQRGPAYSHDCSLCGATASRWTYDGTDPSERVSERYGPFSDDPTHYLPLCDDCTREET